VGDTVRVLVRSWGSLGLVLGPPDVSKPGGVLFVEVLVDGRILVLPDFWLEVIDEAR